MTKTKISYIVQSSIGIGVWIFLTAVASLRVASAMQLGVETKIIIWGFLWGLVVYFVSVLVRHYNKLDDSTLE